MLLRVSLPGDSNSINKILNDFIPNYSIVWNEAKTKKEIKNIYKRKTGGKKRVQNFKT